jgi:hypothetical protein
VGGVFIAIQSRRAPLNQARACIESSLEEALRPQGNKKFVLTMTSSNCTCAAFVSCYSVPDLDPGIIWTFQGQFHNISSVKYDIGSTIFLSPIHTPCSKTCGQSLRDSSVTPDNSIARARHPRLYRVK